jgi:copper homeostasis protein
VALLEVCIDDLSGLDAAIAGGADRVELCSALALGGLTPSLGLMEIAGTYDIPSHAMIRPRAGDFVYGEDEVEVMLADIAAARAAGLAGVVLGASLPDGRLDRLVLRTLAKQAEGLDLTLHRAFDLVPNGAEAVEIAIGLGFSRILTSGGARIATEGIDGLRTTIAAARGRIVIMPGAGIAPGTVGPLLALGCREIHASCSEPYPAQNDKLVSFGFAPASARRTDPDAVRALKAAISAV